MSEHCGVYQRHWFSSSVSCTRCGMLKADVENRKNQAQYSRKRSLVVQKANDAPLCACGCGKRTTYITNSCASRGHIRGEYRQFILGHSAKGDRNTKWKGGRRDHQKKYTLVLAHGHPHEDRAGYVREHILIVVKALGHPLPEGVVIHHHDRDGKNNANTNLVVCQDQKYHLLIHLRTKAFLACGDPAKRRCIHCKEWDSLDKLHVGPEGPHGQAFYHNQCANARNRAAKLKRVANV